jgi:hypothetical protein
MNANPNKDKRCALCNRWLGNRASTLSKGSSPGLVKIKTSELGDCAGKWGKNKSAQQGGTCPDFILSQDAAAYKL